MLPIAERILRERKVVSETGQEFLLDADTPLSQCEFLQEIIADIDAIVAVEVGLAFGVSALFIGEALMGRPGRRHIIIDPFQSNYGDEDYSSANKLVWTPSSVFEGTSLTASCRSY
jgi:hypothetical protein